jgi:hypothetical protein
MHNFISKRELINNYLSLSWKKALVAPDCIFGTFHIYHDVVGVHVNYQTMEDGNYGKRRKERE